MILSKSKIKSINPDSLLSDFIQFEKLGELLIIVPTNRKIRYLKRELISQSPEKSVSKLNLHTIGTLSTTIFQAGNFNSAKVLSDASAAVLLNMTFAETELKYFSIYRDGIPRGTLDRIKNVISEYKRKGILPENILTESEKLKGSEKLKAVDIANIYKNYLLLCEKLNAYEIGDIYTKINLLEQNKFEKRFRNTFGEIKKIIVNGFDEFTKPEIEIINHTAEINDLELFITFDYYRYNPALFGHLDGCYSNLKAKGFTEVEDTSPNLFRKYQKRIREKLFLLDENETAQPSEVEIIKIKSASPEEEIKIIAKEIKSLIINHNASADSITVSFNLISDHSAIVRDVFNEYGIPFNLTDRFALSESQPIIALINFLEIIENNFYFKNIFRALTGRWIKIGGVDLSNLLRVSSNLKIVSGYKNWIETIDRTVEEIQQNSSEDDNRFLPVEFYLSAKDDIEKINELLAPFKQKKTISAFKNDLRKLIYTLQFADRLVNDHEDYIEKNVKALTVFLETIDELFDLLLVENGNEIKFAPGYFLSQIKTALQFTRYNVKERHGSGVLVTSVNEIRGLDFDYVFIGGLVDCEFPTRYQPEIFFSGSFKKDEYRHILEDRYHFYQTLCCAKKRLYLTYAAKAEKKEFTCSTFVSDFLRLFVSKEKNSSDFANMIYSKAELLKFISVSNADNKDEVLFSNGIDAQSFNDDLQIDLNRQENPFGESSYTGFISTELSDEAKKNLLEQKENQYSASQLEEYAKCPFQYFLKRILQLETIDEPSEELESFELGSLVHSILYEFYKSIKEKNIVLSCCDDATFLQSEKILFDIAEKKIEKLRLNSSFIFFEREIILGVAGNFKNSILYRFLEEERINDDGFLPQYFEFEFGQFKNSKLDEVKEMLVGDVKVRGKIDRIDINDQHNLYKVVDYKLGGKKPSANELQTGLSLQLPLYLYASKKLIETELSKGINPVSTVIYSLKLSKGDFGKKNIHITGKRKPDENDLIKSSEDLINICSEFIPKYVEDIAGGKFNLSLLEDRESKVCRFCDFKSICRIQEVL